MIESRYRMVGIFAAVALSVSLPFNTAAQAETKISMAATWGGGPLLEMQAKGFAKDVALLTNGEINIEVFPGGTLGKALKVTETVRNGVAQAGHTNSSYDWGIDRTGALLSGFSGSLPFEQTIHWMYKGGGLDMWKDWRMAKFGVVGFPCGVIPKEIFAHSHKKVTSLAEFKGLKLRTSGAWAEIAAKLGASTVSMPGSEVFPALERGVVDAIEWGPPAMNVAAGFHEIAPYTIVPGVHQPLSFQECQFNQNTWEGFTANQRSLIEIAARRSVFDNWMQYGHDDAAAFTLIASKTEVVDLDDAFKAAAFKASIEWADAEAGKNPTFNKVWSSMKAYGKVWESASRYR
jgi:TRAP-type mannitol/chloroaromatic compound transport system substrate-binding protein